MNTKLLFLQLLIAAVSGQDVGTSPAPSDFDLAASVGLAQPTSPWIEADAQTSSAEEPNTIESLLPTNSRAKETSADVIAHPAPTGPVLNLLNNGADGDLHGPVPRQNLVYFGVGRHGFGFGAECDEEPCHQQPIPCNHPQRPHLAPPPHQYPPPSIPQGAPCHGPGPVYEPVNDPGVLPYLKVTPSQVVQTFTRTHIETGTSTSLEISSYLHTRTVTEELHSTKTNILHPEKTYTHVDKHTIYEYPASTIDASRIRPYTTHWYPERHAHAPCK